MSTAGPPLRDVCAGRWPNLLPLLGVSGDFLSGKHGPCPMCGGKDRFRFDDKDGRGTWICSQCGSGDGISLAMRINRWDFKEAAERIEAVVGSAKPVQTRRERDEDKLREAMNALWRSGAPVSDGDPVALYLKRRGLSLDRWPAALRFVEKCRYQGDEPRWFPAMVAKVVGPDGKPVTIHRTYLTDDGRKASVEAPRRLMPGKIVKGCAIRLAEPGPVLGIAEGIETALSASQIWGVPCWSAVNSSMLMAWEPPAPVKEIVVFGDNDPKYGGQAAAFALAHRLSAGARRLPVKVEMPPDVGMDWNDVLQAEPVAA